MADPGTALVASVAADAAISFVAALFLLLFPARASDMFVKEGLLTNHRLLRCIGVIVLVFASGVAALLALEEVTMQTLSWVMASEAAYVIAAVTALCSKSSRTALKMEGRLLLGISSLMVAALLVVEMVQFGGE
jgi:hypothetical protein